MSQDVDTSKPASEQFDLSTETNDEILDPEKLHEVARELERVPDADLSSHADDYLGELVEAVKRLESAAEDARKEGYEEELSSRVDVGEVVHNVEKVSGRHSYVTDADAAFEAVEDAGVEPLSVAKVSVGDLRDVLGTDAEDYLDYSEYEYFKRQK
jgi:hypothetical protein